MAERLFERAGGFAAHLGVLAGDGVKRAVRDIRETARERAEARRLAEEARVAREKLAVKAVEAAVPAFQKAVSDAFVSYVPQLTQAEVDAVYWTLPEPVERLLSEELARIRVVLMPLLRSAGFPLETQEKPARALLERVWREAWKPFEAKAFGDLKLPRYFQFIDGVLSYEGVSTLKEDETYGQCYVGDRTGYRYLTRPVLSPAA